MRFDAWRETCENVSIITRLSIYLERLLIHLRSIKKHSNKLRYQIEKQENSHEIQLIRMELNWKQKEKLNKLSRKNNCW